MSQINVTPTRDPVEVVDTSGDRSAAAGINLITVVIVLAVLAVIAWFLFTGPLRSGFGSSGSTTNINVNPAPTSVNVNPVAPPQIPAPAGNTGTGNTGTGNTGNGNTGNTGTGTTGGTGTNP
jgi:hypothetical protein